MNISEATHKLSIELGFDISAGRVRDYCDLIEVPRADNNYREINTDDYNLLELITVLVELGIPQEEIVLFIRSELTAESYKGLIERIHSFKSNLVPKAEEILSKYTFSQLP